MLFLPCGATQLAQTCWLACFCALALVTVAFVAKPRVRSAGPAARGDAWRVIGPGGGGSNATAAAISPHDSGVVLLGSEMTGSYISLDAGNSWRMFNLGQVCYAFAFDHFDPGVIYAGTIFLWRSADCGRTWSRIYPSIEKKAAFYYQGDHGYNVVFTDDQSYPSGVERVFITAVAVHPRNPDVICLAHKGDWSQIVPAAICMTRDGGRNWRVIGTFVGESAYAIHIDPDTSNVMVVTQAAVRIWNGAAWKKFAAPFFLNGAAIGRSAGGEVAIYATADARWENGRLAGGVVVSTNMGGTWREIAVGLGAQAYKVTARRAPQFHAVACCAADPRVVYVGFKNLALSSKDELYGGVARSTDAGMTWKIVKKEPRLAELDTADAAYRRILPAGNAWFDEPATLAVSPTDGNVCCASDLYRTIYTRDGGRAWSHVLARESGRNTFGTRGVDTVVCYGVHFDPFDGKRIFADYGNIGLWRSEDGGKTWTSATDGLPPEWRSTSYWLQFDPDVKGLVWGAFGGMNCLPRPRMWRRRSVSTYRGGIATSTDGGRTWLPVRCETRGMAATHVILDPASPAGRRTLYACGFGKGVLKSTDNGRTWEFKNAGIDFEEPFAWRLTLDRGTLYLVIARRHEWGESKPWGRGALYRSCDGAGHWQVVTMPEEVDGPCCLEVDAADPDRLYLAAWGRYTTKEDVGGGVYLSADGGNTWRRTLHDDLHVFDVTMDSRNGVLYAVGFESSAYRSDDRGESWKRIGGYNFRWGHRVIPDPADEDMIYIATFGGGIWYGPAAGDTDAVEDILTPLEKAGADSVQRR